MRRLTENDVMQSNIFHAGCIIVNMFCIYTLAIFSAGPTVELYYQSIIVAVCIGLALYCLAIPSRYLIFDCIFKGITVGLTGSTLFTLTRLF